jgi:hypothetical protein
MGYYIYNRAVYTYTNVSTYTQARYKPLHQLCVHGLAKGPRPYQVEAITPYQQKHVARRQYDSLSSRQDA